MSTKSAAPLTAGAIEAGIAAALLDGLKAHEGASRFAHDGTEPQAGYIVSDPAGDHRLVKPAGRLTQHDVVAWVQTNRSNAVILGSWEHDGEWYLDVNDFLMDRNRAFLHAVIAKEKAIYSVVDEPHQIPVPREFGTDRDLVNAAALLITFTSLALDPNSPFGSQVPTLTLPGLPSRQIRTPSART